MVPLLENVADTSVSFLSFIINFKSFSSCDFKCLRMYSFSSAAERFLMAALKTAFFFFLGPTVVTFSSEAGFFEGKMIVDKWKLYFKIN